MELAESFELDLVGDVEFFQVNEVIWARASFDGPLGDLTGKMKDWIAVCRQGENFIFVLATAPAGMWDAYADMFQAVFQSMDFP